VAVFLDVTRRLGPVGATMAAALLIVVGLLIIAYPGLLAWVIGIGLGLVGVGLLATASAAVRPPGA